MEESKLEKCVRARLFGGNPGYADLPAHHTLVDVSFTRFPLQFLQITISPVTLSYTAVSLPYPHFCI
jgi:hypothetical protein